MALDDLKEVIEKLQDTIKTYRDDYLLKKEARTRLVLIDPLLQALGGRSRIRLLFKLNIR